MYARGQKYSKNFTIFWLIFFNLKIIKDNFFKLLFHSFNLKEKKKLVTILSKLYIILKITKLLIFNVVFKFIN